MWNALTSVPEAGDVIDVFAVVSMAIFGLVFLLSAIYSARPWTPPLGDAYSRRFIRRSATLLGWISGIGLFFLLIRLLQINPISLGLPIWTLLTLIALVAALIFIGIQSVRDREIRRLNRSGHRASKLTRRPVRKAH
jgi:hypothetical protein